ncbi:MAG: uracil-DNA glycosylase family protein [Parvibaculum sp.]|uniref:uracil-DNA glycosylase family protein n=1 Tax=Parvibaculum sp. TaxID=2024848 RepID=UPI00284992B7|nr:uracil-DNA glycosylase family protein [Parvibaculum sp.]MDR3499560.1 uracil-DNA glycosylase family protein [Parvibaculum sp.]
MPTRLDKLAAEIRACRICVEHPQGKPLPHEPRPVLRVSRMARICLAGQAPGTKVHASGMPFTDASGDRLRDWMGVTSEEFYDTSKIAIVPMGFCFPGQDAKGGDLPPRRECAPHWRARLFAEMPQVELTLLIGQYAQGWHLGEAAKGSLTETVAAWRGYLPRAIPLPHPSWRNNGWIRKNPWFETEVLPMLRMEIRRLIGKSG